MKRILTTLIFIGICTLNAQTPANYYLDSLVTFKLNNGKVDSIKQVFTSWVRDGNYNYIINYVSYIKNNGNWVLNEKHDDVTDTLRNYFWNFPTKRWKLKNFVTNNFNIDSTLMTNLEYRYNSKSDTLINYSKYTVLSDSLKNTISDQLFYWDTLANDWSFGYNGHEFVRQNDSIVKSIEVNFFEVNGIPLSKPTKLEKTSQANGGSIEIYYSFDQDNYTWHESAVNENLISLESKTRTETSALYRYDVLTKSINSGFKTIIFKDSIKNTVSNSIYTWDTTAAKWKIEYHDTLFYDDEWKNIIRNLRYGIGMQNDDSLTFDEVHHFVFNATGAILLDSSYDNINQRGNKMTANTYNAANQITSCVTSTWDYRFVDTWIFYDKKEMDYDERGNQTSLITYYWDWSTNKWLISEKKEMNYDERNNQTSILIYYWDEGASTWVNYFIDSYIFNQDNIITEVTSFNYDNKLKIMKKNKHLKNRFINNIINYAYYEYWSVDSLNGWFINSKGESFYNNQGSVLSAVYYTWDAQLNKLILSYEESNTYDQYGNPLHLIKSNSPKGAIIFFEENGLFYSYHDLVTNLGAEDWTQDSFVYPNPTKDYLNLSQIPAEQYQILDISGTVVQEGAIPEFQKSLDLRNLGSGTYLLKLSYKNNVVTKVFVKF